MLYCLCIKNRLLETLSMINSFKFLKASNFSFSNNTFNLLSKLSRMQITFTIKKHKMFLQLHKPRTMTVLNHSPGEIEIKLFSMFVCLCIKGKQAKAPGGAA